jgi:hypothetical protein
MLYALGRIGGTPGAIIMIREDSPPIPFDLAAEYIVKVERYVSGAVNEDALISTLERLIRNMMNAA